jgi:hypothetical protein
MEIYAGIDVSLELTSVCVVDAKGKVVKEAKVDSNPQALVEFFLRAWLFGNAHWPRGRSVVPMVACGAHAGGI